ncbi:hypothetical protein Taro_052082 [Colocasia esculenta]|uniref:Uncharacterized protein n=1 Tax=Colocasia esculenta TaxID=4460 RepID=A0A843XIL4_COLES|nr:hypothetical protein [Colocasia esculenta]
MGHGALREGSLTMVPLMAQWEVVPDLRVTDRRAEDVRVVWTPYTGETDTSHLAVAAGRPLFDWNLLLLCLGTCEVLYLEFVMQTLGWHQSAIEVLQQTELANSSTYLEDYRARYAGRLRLDRRAMPESQVVRLLEGWLAEQAVELERLRAETRTLREYERARTPGRARLRSQREGTWRSNFRRLWIGHRRGSRSWRLSDREEEWRPFRRRWTVCGWSW